MWVPAAEARKAEERAPYVTGESRDLFDIIVEEAETLARFLLDSGGERHRVVDGCVSLL